MSNKNQSNMKKTPGRMGNVPEKAKNFKGAIKRLLIELKGYKTLIILSLVLAILSSILSLFAPNRLSKLTDEISNGLMINQENLERLTTQITSSFNEENLKEVMPKILEMDLSEKTIFKINNSSKITKEEKQKLNSALGKLTTVKDQTKVFEILNSIPENILKIIYKDSVYKGQKITKEEKIALLKVVSDNKETFNIEAIPDSILNILLEEFMIDKITITKDNQKEFLKAMGTLNKDTTAQELYSKIDTMPNSIREVLEPFMNMNKIIQISLVLVVMYVCSSLFGYIQSISMTNVANKFARKLRDKISKKINLLPLKYFDNHTIGDILSRITNDVDTIAQSMNHSLATLVSAITLFLGSIIMMFYTNWIMALAAILASSLGFIFMFVVLGKSQKYFIERQTQLGNLNGHIEEIYSGLNVVKAYNAKKESDEKFDEYNEKVYNANRKSQFLSGLMQPMMGFVGNFGYVAVCIVGALLVLNNKISFGVIVAFMTYVRLFTSPLSQMAQAMNSLQSTAAASERVFEFVDEEEMSQEASKKILKKNEVKGNIEFSNVSFTYDGNAKPTIKNFSAKAKPGQKIAIVGPTGAGKTTMVNLLMKFYEISSGDIKIDGVSTKELTRNNIHELFIMVLQDTWLFEGTIRENIVYNRKDVDDEKIRQICKTVGLDHFIKTLPNGYNSVISDNENISAGQRQLLTIARGMVEEAPFLILDEATSNVDTRTEELVQKAMDELTKGKTSFIIAHRLSTIKNADLILVMKDGNIIEQGNHEELMNKNGFYADLYNSQFEL